MSTREAALATERPVAPASAPDAGATSSAAVLPPVHVVHDRKQHFSESEEEATRPGTGSKPETAPKLQSASPPAATLGTGVSHPEDYDDEGPGTYATRVSAPMAGGSRSVTAVPVPGFVTTTAKPVFGTPPVTAAPSTLVSADIVPPAPNPGVRTVQPSPEMKAKLPSLEDEVVQTQFVPSLFNKEGHLIVPPALKGSHEILVHQNIEADREGLTRIRDDADLLRLRARKELVALPEVAGLDVDARLPANRRFARPWTARFLDELSRAHYARFHTSLIVTSAVRTVEVQERLLRVNGNAAPAEGETASPHLTGQAVDLGKKGLSLTEIAWMRGYLLPLVQQGKIDVEEEFQQACFHISVYRSYLPQSAPGRQIGTRYVSATALATAIH